MLALRVLRGWDLLTMTFLKAAKKNNWPLTRVFGSCTQTNASFYQQIQKSVLLLRLGQWPGVGGLGQGLARRLGKSGVGKRLPARGRPFLRTHLLQWTMCCPLRKSRPLKLDNFFIFKKCQNLTLKCWSLPLLVQNPGCKCVRRDMLREVALVHQMRCAMRNSRPDTFGSSRLIDQWRTRPCPTNENFYP